MTTNVISLDPSDVRADHPFSHPDYSRRDGEVMRDMIGQVGEWLEPSMNAEKSLAGSSSVSKAVCAKSSP